MKTIVVPIDFSATALNAARYAADLALAIYANVKLLHVMPLPLLVADVPFPYENYGISPDVANQSMNELKAELHDRTNDKIAISGLVTEGVFETQVKGMLTPGQENWVVMGASGAGALSEFIFGSYTIFATKHLSCPLIVVPPGARYNKIESIGLACDMKNVVATIPFAEIKAIRSNFDARLFLLYVSKPGENLYPLVLSESKFMEINLHPDFRILTNEDTSEGLAEFVEKAGIDMLILIARERNFVERIFHKSTTRNLQSRSGVPIMVLHQL